MTTTGVTLLAQADFFYAAVFTLFALLTCGFAAGVLLSTNVVRMAFYLVLSLGSAAGLFFLAGAPFVGAMQLMIYVGGTLVLLIFGVMLTAQQRFIEMKTNAGEWVLSLIVGSALLMLLARAAFSVDDWNRPNPNRNTLNVADSRTATPIGAALAGVRVDQLDQEDAVLRGGMSGYLMPFVIVSMHLLVVLVGASYMARSRQIDLDTWVARPPPATGPARHRGWLVASILILLVMGNVAAGLVCLFRPDMIRGLPLPLVVDLPDWSLKAASILAGLATVCTLALSSWQKWGFFGLVALALAAVVVAGQAAGAPAAVAKAVGSAAFLIGLYVIMRWTGYWAQLD